MLKRELTNRIKVGNIYIGGSTHVLIQSMCNIKTSNEKQVIDQINMCAKYGADLMRVSILDFDDAKAIKTIMKKINIPLVADIHFDYKLAIECIKNGINAIRINPGNIGSIEKISELVMYCKEYNVPIRIGINSGSMDKDIYKYDSKLAAKDMIRSATKHIKILEDLDFHNIVLSLKSSNPLVTIAAYKLASKKFPYPLHLGLTEAGTKDISLIRSAAALSPLLLAGIGDTIRISITGNPEDEIVAAKRLLHDLNLYDNIPTLISCPTCGRTMVDVEKLVNQVNEYLKFINKNITIAIMGCVVNGPGESKNADIGLCGGKDSYVIIKKGKIIKTIKQEQAFDELIKEINSL